jgi:hypothetical protein
LYFDWIRVRPLKPSQCYEISPNLENSSKAAVLNIVTGVDSEQSRSFFPDLDPSKQVPIQMVFWTKMREFSRIIVYAAGI